jgi:hypothetical protein
MADMSPLEKKFYQATAQLFVKENNKMYFLCTATAFAKEGRKTYFVSAAHCATEDDVEHGRVNVSKEDFFINFNDDLEKERYYSVKIVGAGYKSRGDDLLFLTAELDHEVDIMPLADNDASLGEQITNVACPGGYGKQLFRGSISLKQVFRQLVFGDINWTNNMFIQTEVGPGSSGSSIVSLRQKAIVAIVVGMLRNSPSVVTVPVSRVKTVWAAIRANEYHWYNTSSPSKKTKMNNPSNELSVEKLIKQVNDHYPGRPALHLPMPEKMPMPRQRHAP